MEIRHLVSKPLITSLVLFCAATVGYAQIPTVRNILASDKRLNAKISLEYAPLQGRGFLKALWSKSGCEYTAIGGAFEFPIDFFTVFAKNVTVRDMMESYACFYQVKWQKTRLGYALITGNAELEAAFAPKNSYQAERDVLGLEFVNSAKSLSETDRNRLSSSMPVSGLPVALQNDFRKMLLSLEEEEGEGGGLKRGVLSGHLNEVTIRLSSRENEGVTQYNFDFRAPSIAGGFSTTDYLAMKDKRQAAEDKTAHGGGIGAIYDPEKFELSQKELDHLSVLKQPISVNLMKATFVQVMRLLPEKYKLSFICADKTPTVQKADVHINSLTLLDALRSLEKTYENTRWIWMRNSFLVVRRRDLNVLHGVAKPEGGIKLR